MYPLRNQSAVRATAWAVLGMLSACSNDEPAVIFDPNSSGAPPPEITALDPSAEAVAGVTKVKIIGRNFSPALSENFVYFGTVAGSVISASPTEIVAVPPNLVADSLTIRVVVQNAFSPATYAQPYKLLSISNPYGTFGVLNSIAIDAQENIFANPPGRILKAAPPGDQATAFSTLVFQAASTIRSGPGGFLYLQRNRNIRLYRIPAAGGDAIEYARFPVAASFFDFDQNGNVYAGGDAGLYALIPNLTTKAVGQYQNIPIKSVRIFADHVYVATAGANPGIWRNQILATDGSLGNNELYFDWAQSGAFSTFEIGDVTFAEDGDMYVAAERKTSDAILVVHPDKTTAILYPGALLYPVANFAWGNDESLYINHGTSAGVSRVAMGKKGAPYYGRQ
ncbi:MAG: IPT/TIG domain-containing protein [bacterium]